MEKEMKLVMVGIISVIIVSIALLWYSINFYEKDIDNKADYSKIFISNVSHFPENPAVDEEVKFTATITDKNCSYNYTVYFADNQISNAHMMTNIGNDIYEYTINYSNWTSKSLNGTTISYWICICPGHPSLDPATELLCSDEYSLTFL